MSKNFAICPAFPDTLKHLPYLLPDKPHLDGRLTEAVRETVRTTDVDLEQLVQFGGWFSTVYEAYLDAEGEMEREQVEEGMEMLEHSHALEIMIYSSEEDGGEIAFAEFAMVAGELRPVCWNLDGRTIKGQGFGGLLCELAERVARRDLHPPSNESWLTGPHAIANDGDIWTDWKYRKALLLKRMPIPEGQTEDFGASAVLDKGSALL